MSIKYLVDGDSLNVNGDWPGQFAVLRPSATHLFIGRAGSLSTECIADWISQGRTNWPTIGQLVYYCPWTGANDVANQGGIGAVAIKPRLQAVWRQGRSVGMKVVAFTITKGTGIVGAGRDGVRTELNNWIKTGSATAEYDYLIDTDTLFVGLAGANYHLETTLFFDGIHMTTLGASYVAALVNSTLPA